MLKMIRNALTREATAFSPLIVQCAKMEDSEILKIAKRMDDLYGINSAQGNKYRAYVAGRKRHFSPANF